MKPQRLTETLVKALVFKDKPFLVRDTRVKGLMIAVNKTTKSYKVQRDLWVGDRRRRRKVKTVRHTLGTTDELTLDDARTLAMEVIAQIKQGIDPNAAPTGPGADTWTAGKMFEEYVAYLRKRERAERTVADVGAVVRRYLSDWNRIPIAEIKRSMVRERHEHITKKHGKAVANSALGLFRAAYNHALRVVDEPDALPDNPVKAVTFNPVRASNRVIMPDEMPEWRERVQKLENPLRCAMHTFGLFSGLRPGTLVSLRREWVHLDDAAISIPHMKSGKPFDLPLSRYMIDLVREALAVGDVLYPGSPWVFPTRNKRGEVKATATWRERSLPNQTGHVLRHTYRTIAQRAGIDTNDARMLLHHKIPGIDGIYLHEKALFDRLVATQERMTAAILVLLRDNSA
jgi:integrase